MTESVILPLEGIRDTPTVVVVDITIRLYPIRTVEVVVEVRRDSPVGIVETPRAVVDVTSRSHLIHNAAAVDNARRDFLKIKIPIWNISI